MFDDNDNYTDVAWTEADAKEFEMDFATALYMMEGLSYNDAVKAAREDCNG